MKNLVAKLEVTGVWLACALTFKLLGNLKAEGWQLLNDDGSEFPLDAYLSGLDAPR